MGVQGLWELLAPVGRRVSVEALSGRKLAIDASIWIIQFMKAMRDDKGDMIRNAHLLGFFRRICKLLYLRAKPVFVFDGGTPALKRRTVIARRRQREQAQSKIRKTAEKLLLNHLRTRKLDEIAQNIGLRESVDQSEQGNIGMTQLAKKNGKAKAGTAQDLKKQPRQPVRPNGKDEGENSKIANSTILQPPPVPQEPSMSHDNGKLADPFTTQVDGEHVPSDGDPTNNASDGSDNDDNEEYIMLPPTQGRVDPAVLASLPPSMQLNLLVQMREQLVMDNRKRFQKVAKNPASFSQMQIQAYLKTVAFRRDINQVQKAAAGRGIGGIPSARIASEVDREYIFSTSFQPEKQATEVHQVGTHEASQDNSHASQTSQFQERKSEGGDMGMPERVSLQVPSPKQALDDNESPENLDIEWEDGNEGLVPATTTTQPVKGAIITIEIDQDDLLAEGMEMQKLHPDVGSESEGIEWEDNAAAIEYKNGDASKDAQATVAECEVETNLFTPTGVDSPEVVDRSLMEIEAAELEEAIRQSLQDHKGFKESKLVIRDESTINLNGHDALPLDSIVCESSLSEEAYLARERERKGKAIVEDDSVVFVEKRVAEESKTSTLKRPDLIHVLDHDANDLKPSTSDGENITPLEGLTSQVHGNTTQLNSNSSTASFNNVVSKVDIATLSEGHLCEDASLTIKGIINGVPLESDSDEKLEASIYAEAPSKSELTTEEASICCTLSNSDQVGEENKTLDNTPQAASTSQASVDTQAVDASTDAAMEHSLIRKFYTGDEDEDLQEALLKEAVELDLKAERAAFAKQERDLLAEREELSRQQADLQAVMEAEQAAMQANLQEERDLLLQEEMELRAAQRKNERNAEAVSGEMFSECQELLQMFGLPYIFAPMEAEAQCAYMDSIGLVDGVVTDDCDVFLFGGRNVFKNIFDDRKYVETYYMKDVESELGLNQDKLIHMALLLGSDYTEGVSGIGIVNAIEVVNAFEGEAGLQKFKEWLDAPDLTLLDKFNQNGQKKQTRKRRVERESEAEDTQEPDDHENAPKYNHRQQNFMVKHRAVSKNWNVPESFPNPMVINAYVAPQVDQSSEAFTWGRPDLEALRRLCSERFGWNKSKSDELLLPVLKEYDRHETQLRLEAFYSFNQRFAKIRSKRIQKAVSHVTGRLSSDLVDLTKVNYSESPSPTKEETNDSYMEKEADIKLTPPIKASARRAAGPKGRKTKASQQVATRGRGRGRGGSKSSRGRAKASNRFDSKLSAEVSLSDASSSEDTSDLDPNKRTAESQSAAPRRSNRIPQRTVYNFSGSEDDGDNGPIEKSKGTGGGHDRAGSIRPSDVNNVEEPGALSSSKAVEAETTKDGGEMGATAADGHHGLRVQAAGGSMVMGGGFCAPEADDGSMQEPSCYPPDLHDGSYLTMGGGFCAAAEDDGSMHEPSYDPPESHIAKEVGALNNDVSITPKESKCSDALFVGSITAQELFVDNETAGQFSGLEPTLRAVPLLRRKKRRIG